MQNSSLPRQLDFWQNKKGIFYGTSTGSTAEVAELISEAFGDDATEPIEIEEIAGEVAETFRQCEYIIPVLNLLKL